MRPTPTRIIALAALALMLTACSSGSGGSDSTDTTTNPGTTERSNTSQPSSNVTSGNTVDETEESTGETTPEVPASSGNKSISIGWASPTVREDGSELSPTDLSGFEIYYFLAGNPDEEGVIVIDDPSTNQITTSGFISGTYYFAISSVDTDGVYSALSDYYVIDIP